MLGSCATFSRKTPFDQHPTGRTYRNTAAAARSAAAIRHADVLASGMSIGYLMSDTPFD